MANNKRKPGITGFRGVTLNNYGRKTCRKAYSAKIRTKNKTQALGTFDDPVEAAKAYDRAAKEHHGDFAVLNFPPESLLERP